MSISISRDPIALAERHGAKLNLSPDGWWHLLDQPNTVLWWAYFRDKKTAAHAFNMVHNLTDLVT